MYIHLDINAIKRYMDNYISTLNTREQTINR